MVKLIHGFGINDADYAVFPRVNGGRDNCPAFVTWRGILERCYSDKFHTKNPTYVGVTVCDEWRSFMKFRKWWLENHVDGWELDKDLLTDLRMYSPETCIYVPSWLNTFTIDRGARRGEWPIGVSFEIRRGRFRAQCSNRVLGRNEYLGYFTSPDEAHNAWKSRKMELALDLKPKMDEIDHRIYPRVIEIIAQSR